MLILVSCAQKIFSQNCAAFFWWFFFCFLFSKFQSSLSILEAYEWRLYLLSCSLVFMVDLEIDTLTSSGMDIVNLACCCEGVSHHHGTYSGNISPVLSFSGCTKPFPFIIFWQFIRWVGFFGSFLSFYPKQISSHLHPIHLNRLQYLIAV